MLKLLTGYESPFFEVLAFCKLSLRVPKTNYKPLREIALLTAGFVNTSGRC